MKRFVGLLLAIGAVACAPRYFLPPVAETPAVRRAPPPGVPLAVIEARAFARNEEKDGVPTSREPPAQTAQFRGVVVPSSRGLMLQDRGGVSLLLQLDHFTRVERAGEAVSLEALRPGEEVRASFRVAGEDNVARRVVVLPERSRRPQ